MDIDPAAVLDDLTTREWDLAVDGDLCVAVVGLGWWAREYTLPALAAAEHCTPTVVVSGSADKREAAREAWGTVETGLDYREYANGEAREAYDAVYVCTPNVTHREHVETAARHGKAVCCEKPLETTPERAAAAVAACEEAGVPLMVAYRLQTDPAVRRVRDLVQGGAVGTPVQVQGAMSQPLTEMVPGGGGWRLDPDLVGTGAAVTDIGLYPLNTARFLLDATPERVTASMHSESEAFAAVPDEHATFTVTFDTGVTAQCSVSEDAALSGHLRVVGTAGTLSLEPAYFGNEEQRLVLARDDEGLTRTWTPGGQMRATLEYFAQRVLAGEHIGPDGDHALVDVETVAAVYEAARQGEQVEVS